MSSDIRPIHPNTVVIAGAEPTVVDPVTASTVVEV